MSRKSPRKMFDRRTFLKGAGATLVASAGVGLVPGFLRKALLPEGVGTAAAAVGDPDLYFAGTDGWISLPPTPVIATPTAGIVHPDSLARAPDPENDPNAPPGLTTYIFGFRNVTGLTDVQRANQKNKAQHSAPIFWVKQYDPAAPRDFRMQLTNLGLALRPDLFDAHTIHWHGFRNVIPFFDGEPTGSVSVPAGRDFTYIYRPRDPGTYMFHCHVEDVEHVHMGMTGPVFVRPLQDGNTALYPSGKFAYNDGDGSTGYRPRVRHVPLRGVGRGPLGGRAHPAARVDRLPRRLRAAERPGLPRHAGAQRPIDSPPRSAPCPCSTTRTATSSPRPGSPAPAVPAALVAGDLQRRRAGAAALRQPGLQGGGHDPAGIRMRVVGKDATPMRGRDGTDTELRGEHAVLRRRRERRRHLHGAALRSARGPTTPTSSTTVRTSDPTTWPAAASAGSGPRCASTPAGAWAPQSVPNT